MDATPTPTAALQTIDLTPTEQSLILRVQRENQARMMATLETICHLRNLDGGWLMTPDGKQLVRQPQQR